MSLPQFAPANGCPEPQLLVLNQSFIQTFSWYHLNHICVSWLEEKLQNTNLFFSSFEKMRGVQKKSKQTAMTDSLRQGQGNFNCAPVPFYIIGLYVFCFLCMCVFVLFSFFSCCCYHGHFLKSCHRNC